MKKLLLTVGMGLLVASRLFSQSWTAQTSGTSTDLWGISFIDAVNGWVSGSSGLILHTTDGGTSWSPQTSGVSTPILRNIEFFDALTGWTIGDNGTILSTTDGGVTWSPQTSGVSSTLRHTFFVTALEGWCCGASGTILHTSDGGANWTQQTSGTTIGLMSIQFIDALNGWAVGSSGGTPLGIILHTTDGGANWAAQTAPNTSNLNTCYFTDLMNGWAAGNAGTIFETVDGGMNWTTQLNPSANNVRGTYFTSTTDGWAVGDAGSIVNTVDGGINWATQTSSTNQILRDVEFVNTNRGWAVGVAGTIVFYNLPVITATGTLTSFSTTVGTPSPAQNFTVSGINLTASLDITAPTDFEVSTSAGSGFGASVSLPQTNSIVTSTVIYVRYNPASAGVHTGNISLTSTGATTQLVPVDGTSGNLGINSIQEIDQLSIFPNPANDVVTIQVSNEIISKLEWYNVSGKLVNAVAQLNTNVYTGSISGLESGTYLLQVYAETGIYTARVVIR